MGKVEGNIISLLVRNRAPLTIRQISEKLGKAYPHVHNVTSRLIEEDVLTKSVVGNAYSCSLNLCHDKTKAIVVLEEYSHTFLETKKKRIPAQILRDVDALKHIEGVKGALWDDAGKLVISVSSSQPDAVLKMAKEKCETPCMLATPSVLSHAFSDDHVIFFGTIDMLNMISGKDAGNYAGKDAGTHTAEVQR